MSTETLRDISNILLVLGLVAAACGTFGVNYFRGRLERERGAISQGKEREAELRASALQGKVDELLEGNKAVVGQNEKLLGDIQMYQTDLLARDERIRELEQAAKAARRGLVDRYEFNGAKRVQSGGSSSVTIGNELGVFQRLIELENAKQYSEIIPIAQAQIARTPEWLTPYLFLGVALANTGKKNDAIRNLEFVVSQAAGDPQYKQATELLARLRRAP
jgi:tetratricopeptide (TPR) repeat protein